MKIALAFTVAALSACAPSASDVTSQPVPPGPPTSIPGVSERTAVMLLAECGADMSVFPTAAHLASLSGELLKLVGTGHR